MNASRPLFANGLRLAALGAGALLAGCVGNPFGSAKVDPASPVAADVQRLTRGDRPFPKFSSIPAAPKDIRPLAKYGQDAQTLASLRDEIVRATAPETWTLSGTEDFAAKARKDAPEPPPADRASDPEAFARELRERATPPPPR